MSQRFADDNFIEAAKAYQQIKAPSGLREKVLEGVSGAAAGRHCMEPEIRSGQRRSYGKIYKLGTAAACVAVMALSVQLWGPDGDFTHALFQDGPLGTSVIGTEPDPKSIVEPDGQPQPVNEPVPVQEPVPAEASEPEPAAVYEPEAEVKEENTAAFRLNRAAEPAEDTNPEEESEEDELAGLQEFVEKTPEAVPVSSLLPTMLGSGSALSGWEVRLVNAEDGACTVEITAEKQNVSSLVTVSKNDENGKWELESAEKTYQLKNQ